METTSPGLGTVLLTAIPPVAWGSTYFVTETWLPPDRPLFAATVRALPIGLLLLVVCRRLPSGSWWWRAAVLGVTNIGAFFALVFLAAYHLPGGVASTVTAMSPLVVMSIAWPVLGERPPLVRVAAGVVGVLGVGLLVLRSPDGVTALGVAGAGGAVLVSAVGFVLIKRWEPPTDMLTLVSWQLVAGGLFLLPLSLLVEGGPPPLDLPAVGAFAWLGLVGTGLAYFLWFRGLRRMPAGSAALIGLVNPVVGTALGVWFAHEAFGPVQALGMLLCLGGVVAGQLVGPRPRRGRETTPAPVRLEPAGCSGGAVPR
jgi:probable blue pigment (indigoidine) exporter